MRRKFMVWAVCKCDGSPVAYVEWGAAGKKAAQQLAESMTASDSRAAIGAFFVQPRKVEVEAEAA